MNPEFTIGVTRLDELEGKRQYEVVLSCNEHSSFHHITFSIEEYNLLTEPTVSEEQFVKDCFAFLLEREGQQSILSTFDISVIENYFSDFKEVMYAKYHKSKKEDSFLKRVLFR